MLVGLAAEIGETGVRGRALGDLSDSDGRGTFCAAEMLKDSFGLTTRAVYIVTDEEFTIIEEVQDNRAVDTIAIWFSQGNFAQQRYPSRQGEKQIIDVDVDKELKNLGQPS